MSVAACEVGGGPPQHVMHGPDRPGHHDERGQVWAVPTTMSGSDKASGRLASEDVLNKKVRVQSNGRWTCALATPL